MKGMFFPQWATKVCHLLPPFFVCMTRDYPSVVGPWAEVPVCILIATQFGVHTVASISASANYSGTSDYHNLRS